MIERGAELPVTRPSQLLALSRSSVCHAPKPLPERELQLMRSIDEPHLELQFYGGCEIARELQKEGHKIGCRHVTALMRLKDMEVICRKPSMSSIASARSFFSLPFSPSSPRSPRASETFVPPYLARHL